MSPASPVRYHLLLLCLSALRGHSCAAGLREAVDYDPWRVLGASLKREVAGEEPYHRALRCLDALSLQGQFTFTADQPQLHCAAFLIAEPGELLTVHADHASLDCQHGDFLKVFDGWILKGEKFPSTQDHPLPMPQRYVDLCAGGLSRGGITSSQNVAMLFFRVHEPGNGFTVTIRTHPNLFPCNAVSPSPSGRFTLVVPQQRRNCSFSVVYPVVVRISGLALGRFSGLQPPSAGCGGMGDFVELLGGAGLDPSKMMPLADLCYPFRGPDHSPTKSASALFLSECWDRNTYTHSDLEVEPMFTCTAQMKIGCDSAVVRMVSSGRHTNRMTVEYRQLEPQDMEAPSENSLQPPCVSGP